MTELETLELLRINDALYYNMQTLEAAKNGEKNLYFRGEKKCQERVDTK